MSCLSPISAWKVPSGLSFTPPPGVGRAPDYLLPCGRCLECKERKRLDWSRRIILESMLHDESCFVTLTYDDAHLPVGAVASKSDVQKFLKRLRQSPRDYHTPPCDFRYFIVSEYGKKHGRPHYHGILFGVDVMHPSWRRRFASLRSDLRPIYTSDTLASIWSNGFVSVDSVTPQSVGYVCKYISKDSRSFRLCSRGLGKGLFFDGDRLTDFGFNCYQNGFVVYPVGNGKNLKGAIPKNIDRYLKLYEPLLAFEIGVVRSEFARRKMVDSRSLADRISAIKIKDRQELQKRKLDNDS